MTLKTWAESAKIIEDIPKEIFEKSVCFAFLTRGNDIFHGLVTYLLNQKHMFPHMACAVVQSSWGPAVGQLFKNILNAGCEYNHLMDSDIGLRHDVAARLIMHDKDIVASPIHFYDPSHDSIHLNVHYDETLTREYTPRHPEVGLEPVFATSFGSVMVKRRVLESFMQNDETFVEWSPLIHERYKEASPDTIFFIKARELGYEIFMDWACPMGTHHKYVMLNHKCCETYFAHRILDAIHGAENKREMFKTDEGRKQLTDTLSRPLAVGSDGRGDE